MVVFDESAARKTDRAYLTPDVVRQRMRTLEALQLKAGEFVLDVGCGTGLLTHDMATLVGPDGRVVGVDVSPDMLKLAEHRCADLPQVHLKQSKAESLSEDSGGFDAVTCTQVLLFLPDVAAGLAEMHRVLNPGGRIVIIETEWRGMVLNSFDDALTRKMIAAWDNEVSSPNLPVRLGPLMKAQGFSTVSVSAFPILNTNCTSGNFSFGILEQFARHARERGAVSATESEAWLDDLQQKGVEDSYFFCVNRFVFTAVKL